MIRTDGKQFAIGTERFRFRGVTYGTFRPREADGARFPDRDQLKLDLAAIADAGFTVVRTYTEPPDDLLDLAADFDLRVLAGIFYPDWRYLVGSSRRDVNAVSRRAREEVRRATRRLAGDERVLAVCLGNEVPADVLRWVGTSRVAKAIDELVDVAKSEDPDRLITYANYPTTEYLTLDGLDFLTFNVFLERRDDLRRYLTRLHHLAGDRPIVLGELGLSVGDSGEQRQADFLDWQLETAIERGVAGTCVFSWTDEWFVGDAPVEGWHFGLTRADRSPRPALEVAKRWNEADVSDLDVDWPSISVVICAYNAEATLDECLRHTTRLDYPNLEIVVVDDGSTDRTAAIARKYARVQLLEIEHGGLSVARNEGYRAATGDLIAYLDSDAYPTPEWPYYLALGLDGRDVGGVGGPNLPPVDDPTGAQVVARAPGGPVHVLVADDRAEHVPGCNMAFWKSVLVDVGGFDPIYMAAGDDVDLCWKVLDRGWEIGFHPAALVWHHRRPGLRPYLRQQRGYGRAEALVEARHPDRFTPIGTARWRGRIYNSLVPTVGRQRIYRGLYGAGAYQSIYQGGGHGLDVAHQVGVPVAAPALLSAPLALVAPHWILPSLVALVLLGTLFVVDVVRASPPRHHRRKLRFRASVAAHHLLQPLVRTWGRVKTESTARRDLPNERPLPGPVRRAGRGVLLLPHTMDRAEMASRMIAALRRAGLRVLTPTGWEDHDARVVGSTLVFGDLITSAHVHDSVQARVRRQFRRGRLVVALVAATVLARIDPVASAAVLAVTLAESFRGWWKTGPFLDRVVRRAATGTVTADPAPAPAPAPTVIDLESETKVDVTERTRPQTRRPVLQAP